MRSFFCLFGFHFGVFGILYSGIFTQFIVLENVFGVEEYYTALRYQVDGGNKAMKNIKEIFSKLRKIRMRKKKSCQGCRFTIGWLSWISRGIRLRTELTPQQKLNLIRHLSQSAPPNWNQIICMKGKHLGHFMKKRGAENKRCRAYKPELPGLGYDEIMVIDKAEFKVRKERTQRILGIAGLLLTFLYFLKECVPWILEQIPLLISFLGNLIGA